MRIIYSYTTISIRIQKNYTGIYYTLGTYVSIFALFFVMWNAFKILFSSLIIESIRRVKISFRALPALTPHEEESSGLGILKLSVIKAERVSSVLANSELEPEMSGVEHAKNFKKWLTYLEGFRVRGRTRTRVMPK